LKPIERLQALGKIKGASQKDLAEMGAYQRFQAINPAAGETSIKDAVQTAKDIEIDRYLRGRFPQGAARTMAFGAIGGLSGYVGVHPVIGGSFMALVGKSMDEHGGKAARKLYRLYLTAKVGARNTTGALPLGLSLAAGKAWSRIEKDSLEYKDAVDTMLKDKDLPADKKIQ
jgi:hypothetical protein